MRVVLNQLAAAGSKTGIGHYATELFGNLRQQARGDVIDSFPPTWVVRALGACKHHLSNRAWRKMCTHHPAPEVPPEGEKGRKTSETLVAAVRAMKARWFLRASRRYDLYHEPNFIPLPSDCPVVATLHDLSVLLHPEWHPPDRVARYEAYFSHLLKRCVHFFAISDFGRRQLISTLGISPERVTRTYMGVRSGLRPLPREQVLGTLRSLGLPEQYLLHLGTLEPRKNLLTLMRAYCSLPGELRDRWPLLLVGPYGWKAGAVVEYLHRHARHRGVISVGYVPEKYLGAIYNGARALVFPSHYEGFGLPPLEMLACGGAVICSTAEALVEVVGGKAHLVAAADLDGWRDALQRVLTEEDFWRSLREGAQEKAKPFSWERCASETLRVYRQLTGVSRDREAA